jgi:hypothetical protein
VYCSNALTFNCHVDLEYDSVEILWLEICPFKSKPSLLVSGCYSPPSYSRDDDKLFDQCIETAYLTNKEVILTGDFNINFLSQEFKKHYLSKSLMNMHFSQLVSDVTRPSSGTCLDHIYTNKCQHITAALVENYALSDHLPTFAVRKYFKQSKSTNSHDSITYRDLKNLNIYAFNNMLANSPWDTAFILMILIMFSPHGKVYFFKQSTNMPHSGKCMFSSAGYFRHWRFPQKPVTMLKVSTGFILKIQLI